MESPGHFQKHVVCTKVISHLLSYLKKFHGYPKLLFTYSPKHIAPQIHPSHYQSYPPINPKLYPRVYQMSPPFPPFPPIFPTQSQAPGPATGTVP